MEQKSSKDLIREWLQKRQANRTPLPNIDHIRRDVGWSAVATNKRTAARKKKVCFVKYTAITAHVQNIWKGKTSSCSLEKRR